VKNGLGNLSAVTVDRLAATVKNRLKHIQYRPELINGFLAQAGLALGSHWPAHGWLSLVVVSYPMATLLRPTDGPERPLCSSPGPNHAGTEGVYPTCFPGWRLEPMTFSSRRNPRHE
jgi:hypothetical protein